MTASLLLLIPLSLFSTTDAFKSDIVEALMVESLRNNLVQACDNEKITLHCPRNTHIMLENVFYGRLVPSNELCPVGGISGASIADEDTSCDVSEARMKISELCRNKRKCRIHVKASFFDRDPCPNTSKYLQISYKCKPISFEDQNFCEGSTMQLSCKQNKRLSVYSAHYGRTVNGQAMHCALGDPVHEDCVSDVLPQILHKCHAQTECTIPVHDSFLGNPCANGVQKYLSLIFMCVNDEVFSEAAVKDNLDSMRDLEQDLAIAGINLKSNSLSDMVKDEPNAAVRPTSMQLNPLRDSIHPLRNDAAFAPDPGHRHGHVEVQQEYQDESIRIHSAREEELDQQQRMPNAVGVANDIVLLVDYIKENKEKALLYFFLSASAGIILLLLACICYQCNARRRDREIAQTTRLEPAKSAELSSLIGSSNASPVYLDSDSRLGVDISDLSSHGHYTRFTHVATPPRIPSNLHYYS